MIQPMFTPVDVAHWPDLSGTEKLVDVVIYDKIRWDREARCADLLEPLKAHLDQQGLTYTVLRYGHHHLSQFKEALGSSGALVFICEHEAQGIAYQEALASGIPVLAWDEGRLRDPRQAALAPEGLVVSSVPYFDNRCGMTFKIADLTESFDQFWSRREAYRPRDYISEALSPAAGARRYLDLLDAAKARATYS
ncbi:glycosyltransferase [Aestuariibius insulae]|uniref:glycosyltransferase n=1 Tax=Aestuariibius insulae TaxID=2058287 RepID=UPI00345E58F2